MVIKRVLTSYRDSPFFDDYSSQRICPRVSVGVYNLYL